MLCSSRVAKRKISTLRGTLAAYLNELIRGLIRKVVSRTFHGHSMLPYLRRSSPVQRLGTWHRRGRQTGTHSLFSCSDVSLPVRVLLHCVASTESDTRGGKQQEQDATKRKKKVKKGTVRHSMRNSFKASLGAGVELKEAVRLPPGQDRIEWIAMHSMSRRGLDLRRF